LAKVRLLLEDNKVFYETFERAYFFYNSICVKQNNSPSSKLYSSYFWSNISTILARRQASDIAIMFLTDLVLGLHGLMIWTYSSFLLIGALTLMSFKLNLSRILLISIASPTLFFVITNFGVWMGSSFYPNSFDGLIACYTLGLPFYSNSLISTLLFSSCFYLIAVLQKENTIFKKTS
jgi:hypothetical protein